MLNKAQFRRRTFQKPNLILNCRDGAVVRALVSQQCRPGLIPGLINAIYRLSVLLVRVPASSVFLRVLRFSSLHNNQKFQKKKKKILDLETVDKEPLCRSHWKSFLYLFSLFL